MWPSRDFKAKSRVQRCPTLSLLPHVATGHLNVARGRFSRNGFIVKILTKLLFNSIFLHIVATAKTLSPQKRRMWRQGSFWLDNVGLDQWYTTQITCGPKKIFKTILRAKFDVFACENSYNTQLNI